MRYHVFFFFQAEDGIRDVAVTGVQTCALPICIWVNCALIAALIYGNCTTPTTTTMIASATNGARKRGFSRTRSNTAVGSNNTRTRSRTAPIAPSRTQGSPSQTAGTAPNIREKQILGAPGRVDDGAHDPPSFNPRLTQQVGILQPWSRHYNRSLEPARSRDRLRRALRERQFVRLQIHIPDNAAHLDRHAVVPGGRPTVENDDVMATCVLVTADQARRVHCRYTAQIPQGDCDGACAVEGGTHLRFSLPSHW